MTRDYGVYIGIAAGIVLICAIVRSLMKAYRNLIIVALLLCTGATLRAEWVTPKGKSFHTQRACIALRTTSNPEHISRAEAERRGLHICGICNRRKGGK